MIAAQPPLATALLARCGDDVALTRARRARRDAHELSEERPLCATHLARATTGVAALRLRALLGARTLAPIARVEQLRGERLLDAGRDFLERQLHGELHIAATPRIARPPAATSAGRTEQVAQPAEAAEVAHEDAERFGEIHVMEAGAAGGAAQPRFTVAVVRGALVRIAQHVVRLGDRLELLLRFLRPVVAVGVELHRELAIRLLDVVVGRRLRDAEDRVIISHKS